MVSPLFLPACRPERANDASCRSQDLAIIIRKQNHLVSLVRGYCGSGAELIQFMAHMTGWIHRRQIDKSWEINLSKLLFFSANAAPLAQKPQHRFVK